MRTESSLEGLVEQALGGSRDAVEELVHAIQDDIYRLALRMLWHPHDAADATQEILIKVVTRLDSFRRESSFRTWYFRIASNHLLTIRASLAEHRAVSFESLGEELVASSQGPERHAPESPEDHMLEQEVKLGCTLGILLCLDRPHRLAYIVGEILGFAGDEGADITDVEPATYRKRLSRARMRMREFMEQRCGIVNPSAPCRCSRKISPAIQAGRLNPEQPLFAVHEQRPLEAQALLPRIREMEELHATVQLYRSHPDYAAPATLARSIRELLSTRSPSLLAD